MALKSASPLRPARGGARHQLDSPKTKTRPTSRWRSKNLSRAKVSGSLPDQGPASGAWILIKVGEGRADVDAARPVLVELPVAVVVEALGVELPDALLALGPVRFLHQAGFAGDGDPFALGVLDPDLGDEAVAVEVVGPVLVDRIVLIVVLGAGVARVEAPGLREVARRGVGIAAGEDVPGPVRARAVLAAEKLGQVERRLAGERDGPFHVGRHEDGGQGLRGLAGLRPDLEQGEVAAARALGQDVDLGEAGIGPGQVLEGRRQFLGRVVAVEGDVGRGQGSEGETGEGKDEESWGSTQDHRMVPPFRGFVMVILAKRPRESNADVLLSTIYASPGPQVPRIPLGDMYFWYASPLRSGSGNGDVSGFRGENQKRPHFPADRLDAGRRR